MKTILAATSRATFWMAVACQLLSRLSAEGLHPYGPPTGPQMEVVLYSGRTNPCFELTEGEIKRITETIEKLPVEPGRKKTIEASLRLGYAGIVVGMLPTADPKQRVLLRVYRKDVDVTTISSDGSKPQTVFRRDQGRTLETMLAAMADARGQLESNKKQHIASGVDGR